MRRLLWLIPLLLCASATWGVTPAFVSGHFTDCGGSGSTVTTVTCPTTSNNAGNAILVWEGGCVNSGCNSATSGITLGNPTDTTGNTYSQIFRYDTATTGNFEFLALFCANSIGAASGTNATTGTTNGAVYFALSVSEWTNQNTSCASLLDQSGSFEVASTTSPISVSTSGSTVNTNEAAFAACNSASLTPGGSYAGVNSSGGIGTTEWLSLSATGTQTATFTFTGTKTLIAAAIVTLTAPGSSIAVQAGFGGKAGIGGKAGVGP